MLRNNPLISLFFILLGFSCSGSLFAASVSSILVEAEEWEGATQKDGTGLYWDIMRRVFEPEGIKINTNTSTFKRSVGLLSEGNVHAMMGAYKGEVKGGLYSTLHFDYDEVSALHRKDVQWQGESTLENKDVAWISGYKIAEFLSVPMKVHEYHERKKMIKLLAEGKLDFVIEAAYDLKKELEKGYVDAKDFELHKVKKVNMYVVFSDDELGKELRGIFDRQFKKLVDSGEAKKLFDKWDWPTFPD
ncbi:MAG: transporter substrate-binding domain-containing protein [Pseudomonadales bacterium]|nr:transporter substrate-binding domain-containing protein [Pseudomonadales bacterium]